MFPFGSLIATYLNLTVSPTKLLILLRPALPTGFLISVHGICDLPVPARDLWCHSRFLFFFSLPKFHIQPANAACSPFKAYPQAFTSYSFVRDLGPFPPTALCTYHSPASC